MNEDKYYDKYYEVSTEDLVLTIDIRNIRTCYNISGGLDFNISITRLLILIFRRKQYLSCKLRHFPLNRFPSGLNVGFLNPYINFRTLEDAN